MKAKFSVSVSLNYLKQLLKNGIDKIHNSTLLNNLYFNKPNKFPWDFSKLRKLIIEKIPIGIYAWYHEDTSSVGNSTENSVQAFNNYYLKPHYLNTNKTFSEPLWLSLYSEELGKTEFQVPNGFFTVPYGCASVYGGKSDEFACLEGTLRGNGIYTIPALSTYPIEEYKPKLKKVKFFMFQMYMTTDNDINISIIERAKEVGASVIILTADNPIAHQSYGIIENGADMTFQKEAFQNILHDPVFNVKCFLKYHCVGTPDSKYLRSVASYLKMSVKDLKKSYHCAKSVEFARDIQFRGMARVNHCTNKLDKDYIYSVEHIAKICHEKKTDGSFFKYQIDKGVPLVLKGCITSEEALQVQKLGADGIYVSVHGGRFFYNAKPPIDVVSTIRKSVKSVHKHFGVWFDGGIRNGQSILTAFANGAEFVGIGRPIIYSCVLYGSHGVENIYKQYLYELAEICKLCGIQNLNERKKLDRLLF